MPRSCDSQVLKTQEDFTEEEQVDVFFKCEQMEVSNIVQCHGGTPNHPSQ